jgi:hypothetical protein
MPNFVPSSIPAALPLANMRSLLSLLVFFSFRTMTGAADSAEAAAAELLEQFSASCNFFFFACGGKEEILAEMVVEIFLKGKICDII